MIHRLALTAYRTSKKEFFASVFAFFVAFSVFLSVDALSKSVVSSVERESRPFLGADVVVASNYPIPENLDRAVFAHCERFSSKCVRRASFYSTFLDSEGKTGLVRVVAAEPGYPFYGDFEVERFASSASFSGGVPVLPSNGGFYADASTLARFSSGGALPFFGKNLRPEGRLLKFPDSGFSFGDEGNLVILPYAAIRDVPELRNLARSEFSVLAKTPNDATADSLRDALRNDASLSELRVRNFR